MKYFVLFLLHHVLLQTAESIELRIKWSRWNETNVTFGETIGLIESVSLMMCLAKCQETSSCVAAHVNEENSKCELSAYSPLDGTKSATPRTGWTVYFKDVPKSKPRRWSGFYVSGILKITFTMDLEFRDNSVTGNGGDDFGKFSINGTVSKDGEVVFVKQYYAGTSTGISVEYKGILSENGCEMSGTYTAALGFNDKFSMKCE